MPGQPDKPAAPAAPPAAPKAPPAPKAWPRRARPKRDPQRDPKAEPRTDQPVPWNVVLLDDDEHSYEYVIAMVQELFACPMEKAFKIAKSVDGEGRAVCLTTHKEHAELKRDQILAFGKDPLIASCKGSMTAIIEPAEFGGDDDGSSR
jgi:ATP-dependent Clp protease adaptor protein ClpS